MQVITGQVKLAKKTGFKCPNTLVPPPKKKDPMDQRRGLFQKMMPAPKPLKIARNGFDIHLDFAISTLASIQSTGNQNRFHRTSNVT